jgi:hypothetical protein
MVQSSEHAVSMAEATLINGETPPELSAGNPDDDQLLRQTGATGVTASAEELAWHYYTGYATSHDTK